MWLWLGLLAALFLGFYNICKKISVDGNSVLFVLWHSSFAGLLALFPLFVYSRCIENQHSTEFIYISKILWQEHVFIAGKSLILAVSWLLAFSALKHLPITIVSPIRTASPFFTFWGAVLIYGETPSLIQWFGAICIIGAMFFYAKIGKQESLQFWKSKWIYLAFLATFLAASSGLYDKFLIQNLNINAQTVQFWFSLYLVIILSVIVFANKLLQFIPLAKFYWRWSIPLVGILLAIADFLYFKALEDDRAMIILLSAIKRSQIFITVFVGGIFFHEKNKRKKMIPLLLVMLGVVLILYSAR